MVTQDNVRLAGFWIRFLAFMIDGIILSVISIGIFIPVMGVIMASIPPGPLEETLSGVHFAGFGVAYLVVLGMQAAYFVLQHASKHKATLGMRLCGIQVVNYDYKQLSKKQAFIRYLGYILSGMTFYIGFLMIAFTRKKQGLHDMVAKTYKIRV